MGERPKRVTRAVTAMVTALVMVATAMAVVPASARNGPAERETVTDFDGNGADDLLWYAPGTAADSVWRWNGSGFVSTGVTVNGSYEHFHGDFDGDGRDDIFWYAPGSAADYVWWARPGQPGGFTSQSFQVNGHYRPLVGDFDGDGADDVFWYAPGATRDHLWSWNGTTLASREFDVSGQYAPVVGDFNGNGASDVFWYAAGPAADHLWTSTGNGRFASTAHAVNGTYQTVVGDFDGNEFDDILWYGPGSVADSLWRAGPGGFTPTKIVANGYYKFPGHTIARKELPAETNRPFSSTHVVKGRTITINRHLPVASAMGVTLVHPSSIVERVGWHQAGSGNGAASMRPASTAIRAFVMPSRGRKTGATTAVDIPTDPGTPVWASTTGTVVRAGIYYLRESNGRLHPDVFVAIRPDSNPSREVVMLHMVNRRVSVGDRVRSGETVIADHSRKFPFVSQVDRFTASPAWGHVHMEIRSYSGTSRASEASRSGETSPYENVVPNTPDGEPDSVMCEADDDTFDPCGPGDD